MRLNPLNEVERFFDDFPAVYPRLGWDVAVDVYEQDGKVVAEMQLPGIDPARVEATIEDNVLHVSGDREDVKEERGKQYYRKEISRGSLSRHIRLPTSVNIDEARATYRNGVFRVEAPKLEKEEGAPKKIPIETGEKGEQGKVEQRGAREEVGVI